jgi:hypothetical protein
MHFTAVARALPLTQTPVFRRRVFRLLWRSNVTRAEGPHLKHGMTCQQKWCSHLMTCAWPFSPKCLASCSAVTSKATPMTLMRRKNRVSSSFTRSATAYQNGWLSRQLQRKHRQCPCAFSPLHYPQTAQFPCHTDNKLSPGVAKPAGSDRACRSMLADTGSDCITKRRSIAVGNPNMLCLCTCCHYMQLRHGLTAAESLGQSGDALLGSRLQQLSVGMQLR